MRLWAILYLASISSPALFAQTSFAQQQIPLQAPFSAPSTSSSTSGEANVLHRLTFPSRAATQAARDWLQHDYDVWKATPSTIDVLLPMWTDRSVSVPFESWLLDLGATSSSIIIPSLSHLLRTSPTLGSSYNRMLSSAALANWTSSSEASATQSGASQQRRALDASTIHDSYHPLEAIENILRSFEQDFPGFAKVVVIGASSEGRTIWGLKGTFGQQIFTSPTVNIELNLLYYHTVTNFAYQPESAPLNSEQTTMDELLNKRKNKKKKKKEDERLAAKHGFVVVGAQHAREWIAPATALYAIHDLLLSASSDKASDNTRQLLDEIEFTFIPVLNVDGYAYTWTNNRLWRKNRQPVGSDCFGLDLNRNWPYAFSSPRPNPCSEAYPGSEPFQSPELQALSAYLTHEKHNIKAFLDLHSFGQFILFPYSYSCDHASPDQENHFEAVVGAQKALRAVHGRSFDVGSVCEVSLTAPGGSLDWSYQTAGIRWSFSIELRDQGVFGFLLPPSQIRASGEETAEAFKDLAAYVIRKEAGGRFSFDEE
ncbi:BQ5605_C010g06019 [Microbotryum silenes-dioicae]|uniref:Inactive metallocarboxypeptidase ECM14 n=1 Tax=Microbotryum silenes-dioicae TaxID=796604 RepID=A0A2X0LUG3_9BASI|nr:BQ5605_C010g06019 [Microbotryum silenes-dioicae]